MINFSEKKKIVLEYLLYRWEEFCWDVRYYRSNVRMFYRSCMNCTVHRARLGFNPSDTWALDQSFAKYMLPRLKYFKTKMNSHPSQLTAKQWEREVAKMIAAFELIADDEKYYKLDNRSHRAERMIEEGMDSFIKHYRNLWL